jgi:hypothetical protein
MSTERDPETVKTLTLWQIEADRLKSLSNEDLVKEYLISEDAELITNEMCTRLWPEWVNQKL